MFISSVYNTFVETIFKFGTFVETISQCWHFMDFEPFLTFTLKSLNLPLLRAMSHVMAYIGYGPHGGIMVGYWTSYIHIRIQFGLDTVHGPILAHMGPWAHGPGPMGPWAHMDPNGPMCPMQSELDTDMDIWCPSVSSIPHIHSQLDMDMDISSLWWPSVSS